MRTGINLPVIEQLAIDNYSLYPGEGKSGLDLSFSDGITVIAGINGIGKTTLLTLLLRMLLGPTDPEKAMRSLGRVSQRKLVKLEKFNFFANRVPEVLDENSTATLQFSLGDEKIVLTRYMKDMALKSVKFSVRAFSPQTEIELVEELARRAGLLSGYDFHVVVRYLQFFNEDRLPLLWDPGAQFELYKILFFDEEIASALNSVFADIQSIDTDYRNRVHQLNKRREALPPVRKSSAAIEVEALDKMIEAAQESYQKANENFLAKRARFEELQKAIIDLDIQAEDAQIELAELEQQLTQQDARFILQALPTMGSKEKFLMQGFATGCGCFICGSKSKNHIGNISEKTRNGHCFVCDAPVGAADTANITPITAHVVLATEGKIDTLLISAANIDAQRKAAELELSKATDDVRLAANERVNLLQGLDALNAQRPDRSAADPFSLRGEIEREETALKLLAEHRKELTASYRKTIENARLRMEEFKEDLRRRLTEYASSFLQEQVSVSFNNETPFKLATGAQEVHIPSFTINMTSGTHKIAHERRTSNSVSESQKEFLDLAFRMTLLDIVGQEGPTMLVIETPEASLDSWFMRRAAELMRRFAPELGGNKRKVFATSNVNGTLMIPALLGLVGDDGSIKKLTREREHHFVNLLKLTPPPAALQENKARSLLDEELGKFLHVG
ncbi:AAA domain-containing protein [Pseudomonas sp. URMO17WK12:I1]|uniref:AAA family ATPase n=1 Tax=unclassified Pseudomonas TaxID=196821 RepID=UPI000480C7F2|nr:MULTISPECIES: AAA family ATPase [unclassified Pseudomonas]PZW71311.1 AAA domain-containing protein [Pseudomonas sp. URMO17WK12:I1]